MKSSLLQILKILKSPYIEADYIFQSIHEIMIQIVQYLHQD